MYFYDPHGLTYWISAQQRFSTRDSLVEWLCFETWPCLDSYQLSYQATHCALLLFSMQVLETRVYIQHPSQKRNECSCKWADLLQAESYCISGYFKTEQWANTGYTKCYWFLSMHPTKSTEMRCQQVILGLWRDTSHNSNCLVSSFFTLKRSNKMQWFQWCLHLGTDFETGLSNTILYELRIGYLTRLLQLTSSAKKERKGIYRV